jgi:hypothetical protein
VAVLIRRVVSALDFCLCASRAVVEGIMTCNWSGCEFGGGGGEWEGGLGRGLEKC